jgi:hypothetical protein
MLFSIEADLGSRVTCYLVPDSFGSTPTLRLRSGGVDLLTVEANEVRDALVAAGRHGTGRCGFAIDDAMLPGLADLADLEIVDAATDMLIYRRHPAPDLIEGATFRLETHLLPLWRLDEVFATRFKYWYKGIDRHGRETATQVFCLDKSSIYASGRVLYKNFEYYLAKGVRCFAAIRNPYEELAERLLVLQNVGTRAEQLLGARDVLTFEPAIAFAAELKSLDNAELKKAFKRLEPETAAALSNPLTRQLTTNTPGEMPTSGSVASALEILSSFDAVGLRSDEHRFIDVVSASTGVSADAFPPLAEFTRVRELGRRLHDIPQCEAFLEKDLELFHHISTAFDKVS